MGDPWAPRYPAIDSKTATPLEPLTYVAPPGPAYAKVPPKFGARIYASASQTPRLGFAGPGRTFGEELLIINHYARSEDGQPQFAVLLDPKDGRDLARFAKLLDVRWRHGLALVELEGDTRPHLLDARVGTPVPAVPPVDGYRYGETFWIHLSFAAPRAWIYARAERGAPVFLQEWTDRTAPPAQPDAAFPFFPHAWDPDLRVGELESGSDEVWSESPEDEPMSCASAVLVPPRSHRCARYDSKPLAEDWRVDYTENAVYRHGSEEGFDLDALCPGEEAKIARESRSAPRLRITCDDSSLWFEWTPGALRALAPEVARAVNEGERFLGYREHVGAYEFLDKDEGGSFTLLREDGTRELIADDHACALTQRIAGSPERFVIRCLDGQDETAWFELISRTRKTRARVRVADIAVSPTGKAWALRPTKGGDELVPLDL